MTRCRRFHYRTRPYGSTTFSSSQRRTAMMMSRCRCHAISRVGARRRYAGVDQHCSPCFITHTNSTKIMRAAYYSEDNGDSRGDSSFVRAAIRMARAVGRRSPSSAQVQQITVAAPLVKSVGIGAKKCHDARCRRHASAPSAIQNKASFMARDFTVAPEVIDDTTCMLISAPRLFRIASSAGMQNTLLAAYGSGITSQNIGNAAIPSQCHDICWRFSSVMLKDYQAS